MPKSHLSTADRSLAGRATPRWHRYDPLFDIPLVLPTHTVYRDLEIEPDSSDQEVKWAAGLRLDRLGEEKKELEKKLEAVYAEVDGLRDAERAADEDDDPVAALARLAELEREAEHLDAEFRRHRRRVTEIEGEIHRLHALALDNPDKRREYDRQHPPLALLGLADATVLDFLDDVKTMLFLLRRELAGFLAERGSEVFHPSDLTREDFSYEFTHSELLDGPLTEGSAS